MMGVLGLRGKWGRYWCTPWWVLVFDGVEIDSMGGGRGGKETTRVWRVDDGGIWEGWKYRHPDTL